MLTGLIALLLICLELTALAFAWRAVNSARTSQGAIGWVIFLIAMPYLAVPVFLFLGHHKYPGYLTGRRDSKEVIDGVRDFALAHAPVDTAGIDPAPFQALSGLPVARGNDLRLLIDGDTTYEALFAAIDAARDYVLVQFYIVRDDSVGQRLLRHLVAAAKRGVAVRFMADAVGSHGLPASFYDHLRAAGCRVVDPRHSRGPRTRFHLNFRNHRKTVVIDGITGFTGGLNIGEEYIGMDRRLAPWRDTHAQLSGPIVAQLQLVFAEDWHWASGENLIGQLKWTPPYAEADRTALLLPTGPGDDLETGAFLFFSTIAAARQRVWIASPYFVPETDILSALKHAAMRGVDVRILVPDLADHRVTWLAAFAYFDEIRAAGVRVFRYREGFMHQKVILVDDGLACIGTTNMDNRSFRLNFETMAAFFDHGTAAEVEEMLLADLARADELLIPLSQQPLKVRIGAPWARLFAPVL